MGTAEFPYDGGRTLTHEIGHYLNIFHIWGGGMGDCNEDDVVEDTPFQEWAYIAQCPTGILSSCGSPDMYMNFMDYTDDACLAMFTEGQKLRMLATLEGVRAGLVESPACQEPVSTIDFDALTIRLFPNPANDWLFFEIDNHNNSTVKEIEISLSEVHGKTLFERIVTKSADFKINTSHFSRGMYLLRLKVGKQSIVKKVIVVD